jgi:hypothetical protein
MPTETFGATTGADLASRPIRSLGLTIAGTRLEPILAEFARELERAGIRRVKPVFYLSTEWGVPFGTVAIAIPFYLAHPTLTRLHAERDGHVEGTSRQDILRYLRHEMGHVVNYGYRLYERPDWTERFGSIDTEYVEEYRPEPFSRRYVRHLPGWYAQKHPDEDWAETFAVWMTPGQDWRAEYADWPVALAKLEYCDRVMAEVRDREPVVTAADLDEDVGELGHTLDEFYGGTGGKEPEFPRALDRAVASVFEELQAGEDADIEPRPAAALIRALEQPLMAEVYRWTGHFPERTRRLLRHLARRAEALGRAYPLAREREVTVALTALVTALAMNHVREGDYFV